jgi:hypothetical protein
MSDETPRPHTNAGRDTETTIRIRQLAYLHRDLVTAGCASIRVKYQACCCKRGFHIEGLNARGDPVSDRIDTALAAEIAAFCLQLLERRHPKWYENTGSEGHIEWDLGKNRLRHQHRQTVVTVVTSDHVGL